MIKVKQIVIVDNAKYSKNTSTFCHHEQRKIVNKDAHDNDKIQSGIELFTWL